MARTISNPADNSSLSSSVIRNELQTLENEISSLWPVGSVYINSAVATNPATLLGFGTWVAIGAGRVLVGVDATQSEFDTLGETGGEKTHQLSTGELSQHHHTVNPPNTSTGNPSSNHTHSQYGETVTHAGVDTNSWTVNNSVAARRDAVYVQGGGTTGTVSAWHTHDLDIAQFDSGDTGSNQAHNNLQPYITVYMWTRTA